MLVAAETSMPDDRSYAGVTLLFRPWEGESPEAFTERVDRIVTAIVESYAARAGDTSTTSTDASASPQ